MGDRKYAGIIHRQSNRSVEREVVIPYHVPDARARDWAEAHLQGIAGGIDFHEVCEDSVEYEVDDVREVMPDRKVMEPPKVVYRAEIKIFEGPSKENCGGYFWDVLHASAFIVNTLRARMKQRDPSDVIHPDADMHSAIEAAKKIGQRDGFTVCAFIQEVTPL